MALVKTITAENKYIKCKINGGAVLGIFFCSDRVSFYSKNIRNIFDVAFCNCKKT